MRSQIKALTATRAIAAIMVVIHHYGGQVFLFNRFPKIFHNGNTAVSYFFVLSGFVLYISYNGLKIGYGDYLRKRIGRIVPVYLLALGLFIPVAVSFYDYVIDRAAITEIILSATFLQAYIPGYALTLNSPAWSISVEMSFYLVFPLLLLFLNKSLRGFIIVAILFFTFSQVLHLKYYTEKWWGEGHYMEDFVFFNPVMHINQFMIGMIGGYIYEKWKLAKLHWLVNPCMLVVVIALMAFRPDNVSYQVGLIAPVFMLFILGIAINDPKMLRAGWLVFLGEISYGIYILQKPVCDWLGIMNIRHFHIAGQYFFFIQLGVLIVVAGISYTYMEKPLRRLISPVPKPLPKTAAS
jgi:peptidoglycan/LPS O-acetylase OafA/YrhL